MQAAGCHSEQMGVTPRTRLGSDPPAERTPTPAPPSTASAGRRPALIGRERELQRLGQQLAECRLVTVTGPGGVGKTSLAMAAASQAVTEQARLVVCELAEVESPDAVRHAVAARLGGFLPAGEPVGLPTVSDDGSLLVLLDNCEHVLDAAADVADQLLASGPRVRVLTTSREPLGLPEEQVLLLNPLAVPGVCSGRGGGERTVGPPLRRAGAAGQPRLRPRRADAARRRAHLPGARRHTAGPGDRGGPGARPGAARHRHPARAPVRAAADHRHARPRSAPQPAGRGRLVLRASRAARAGAARRAGRPPGRL